jgi:transposase
MHQYERGLRPTSPICGAIEYALKRWDKLTIYATTHLFDIYNSKMGHLIRSVTIGRKNDMFAVSHDAAQRLAMLYSLPGTCKAHGVNPLGWLKYVLNQLHTHPMSRIKELLPQNYKAAVQS